MWIPNKRALPPQAFLPNTTLFLFQCKFLHYIHFLMLEAICHTYSSLKQYRCIISQFQWVKGLGMGNCVLCSGTPKTDIKVSAELHSFRSSGVPLKPVWLLAESSCLQSQGHPSYGGGSVVWHEVPSSFCFQDSLFGFGFLQSDYNVSICMYIL